MAKVRVERGNVVLKVEENEVQRYLNLGYNVTNDRGEIIQASIPSNLGELQLAYVENQKRIEELEYLVDQLLEEVNSKQETAPKTRKKSTKQ